MSTPDPALTPTEYGFRWGAAIVTRMTSHRGSVCVAVGSGDDPYRVTVYVSPGGRSVRVFVDHEEVTP